MIDTFFNKLRAFLADHRRTKKANNGKKEAIDGAVDEFSADQDIHKFDATVAS